MVQFLTSSDEMRRAAAYQTAVAVLTGVDRAPGLDVESVAQDLVRVATSDADWVIQARTAAVFVSAGRPDQAQRYSGAAQRLIEIHRGSTDVRVRGGVAAGVIRVATKEAAFAFLRPIAAAHSAQYPAEQEIAISQIADLDSEQGAAFLQELNRSGSVRTEGAAGALRAAAASGYRRKR
jgi:hypothetical protein